MPGPRPFTQEMDDLLRRLLYENVPWEGISLRFARPISSCMDRARAIGARRLRVLTVVPDDVSDLRLPLPPGHPETWGLLTRGTCLEGTAYPTP
jgi:hypothetical protein